MTSTTNQPTFNLSKNELSQQLIKLLDLNISLIDIINDNGKVLISDELIIHATFLNSLRLLKNIQSGYRNFYQSEKSHISFIAECIYDKMVKHNIHSLQITPRISLFAVPMPGVCLSWSNSEHYLNIEAPTKDIRLFIDKFDLIISALSNELKRIELDGPNEQEDIYGEK